MNMIEIEKKFIRNFLSHRKYNYGAFVAFLSVAICLIASNLYWDQTLNLSKYLAVNQFLVFEKNEFWRLFSSSFIHGDLDHFLSNTFMLFVLMYFVTSFYGAKISLGLGFFMGVFINLFVINFYEPHVYLVGASGIIYYLWGFWLILYVFIERQMSLPIRILRASGVFIILLIPTTYSPNTSYLAHYYGFFLGCFTGLVYFIFNHKRIRSFELYEYRIVEADEAEPEPELNLVNNDLRDNDHLLQ